MRLQRNDHGVKPGRLRPLDPFARLSPEELIVVAGRMSLSVFQDRDCVLGLGDEGADDYFLLEGCVDLVDRDGRLSPVVAGTPAAATALAEVRPALYEVRARGRVVCARIARDEVLLLRQKAVQSNLADTVELAQIPDQGPALSETQDLSESILSDIRANRLRLPSLPDIVGRIRDALGRANCSNQHIANLIASDPAIAAKILRIANSPLCRGASPVNNLPDAISRVGMFTVGELVTCFSLKDLFRSRSPGLRRLFAERTGEAVRVGACAGVIAERFAPSKVDLALIAGLLSDIGAIPVLERLAARGEEVPDSLRARSLVNRLAPRVGTMICAQWELGEEVTQAIRHGRSWEYCCEGEFQVSEIVICARYHTWLSIGRTKPLPRPDQIPSMRIFGADLQPEDSLAIVRASRARVETLLALLN